MPHTSAIIDSPIGKLHIQTDTPELIKIHFLASEPLLTPPKESYLQHICQELMAYFKNPQHTFSVAFKFQGTAFQQSVWRELQKIPLGSTMTYKEIAERLKSSPRAVGNACRANPIPLIIPCHRVVGQKNLGGFAGDTTGKLIKIKQWLLTHEASHFL